MKGLVYLELVFIWKVWFLDFQLKGSLMYQISVPGRLQSSTSVCLSLGPSPKGWPSFAAAFPDLTKAFREKTFLGLGLSF